MATLRPCSFQDVSRFRSVAAREHVAVTDTRRTSWFLYEEGGEVLGFCGLICLSVGARIKGVWIKPEWRGRGYGRQMTLDLIQVATDDMCLPRLEAIAGNPGFYEAMDYLRVGGPLPNGAVRLARNY